MIAQLTSKRLIFASIILSIAIFIIITPKWANAGNITVDTLIDENDGSCSDGDCSFRDAIQVASAGDTIDFNVTGTITLTLGELKIVKDLTISGPGQDNLSISGNYLNRIFWVYYGPNVTISGLTIENGIGSDDGDCGGAIDTYGNCSIILKDLIFSNNSDLQRCGAGGAFFNDCVATLNNVTFINNSAPNGGGMYNGLGGQATLNDVTFVGNGNGYGGGYFENGISKLTNVTFSNNTGVMGGGIAVAGINTTLSNVSIYGNSSEYGGGIGYWNVGSPAIIKNSIIAGNTASDGNDCYGTINSYGYNLIQDTSSCTITGTQIGNIYNQDPLLGPLQDNGGDTLTRALLDGSPAIDKADFTDPFGNMVTEDQRWVSRPQGLYNDMGGYEKESSDITATPSLTPTPTSTGPTPTYTWTPTYTLTPRTQTPTSTYTRTPTPTKTRTPTSTFTRTPTRTPTITPTPTPNFAIQDVQVNQGLASVTNYVAGKVTAIVVKLSRSIFVDPDPSHTFVIVNHDGNRTTLSPLLGNNSTSEVIFPCSPISKCDSWMAGNYTFDVSINGVNFQKTANFQNRRNLWILVVPINVKVGYQYLSPDIWNVFTSTEFLHQVYPIAQNGLIVHTDIGMDAKNNNGWFDLTKDADKSKLWTMLKDKNMNCGIGARSPCYDYIIGIIPAFDICDQYCSCTFGWTEGRPASVIMENGVTDCSMIDDMQATVAHEIGHNFGLGDEYDNNCGAFYCNINPPPKDFGGRNGTSFCIFNLYKCSNSTEIPWQGNGTGSTIQSIQDGPLDLFNYQKPLFRDDSLSFMGSGEHQTNYWISPKSYEQIFKGMSPNSSFTLNPQQDINIFEVSGWISTNDEITLDPGFQFTGTMNTTISGNYSIEAVDAVSQTLAIQGFDVSFVALSNPPQDIDPAPFHTKVEVPPGTEFFRFKHGDTILKVIPISSNSPTVEVLTPTSDEFVSGTYTVTWQSNDQDGGSIYHILEYSPNGQDWRNLAGPITSTQFAVNFDELPGGNQAYVRVIASDGVNTTSASSPNFIVAQKAPTVYIQNPQPGARLTLGQTSTLYGFAYDLQEGRLYSESALSWSSNIDGFLGNGELLYLDNLSFGQHTITLSAVDSNGLTNTAEVEVFVGHWIYVPIIRR